MKRRKQPSSKMLHIRDYAGDFAEDKDWAAAFREQAIRKVLNDGDSIVLNFVGVTLTTQSFVHALISDILRTEGEEVLDRIEFMGCAPSVKGIIETVVQYSLETTEEDNEQSQA